MDAEIDKDENEVFVIDVDVPLSLPEPSEPINDDRAMVLESPPPVDIEAPDDTSTAHKVQGTSVTSNPSSTTSRSPRNINGKKKKTRKPMALATESSCVEAPEPALRTRQREVSRPTSRSSKTSSFLDVADNDFLTRYKELKLRLKEKEVEIAQLEEAAQMTQVEHELEKEALKPKPLFSWQKKKEEVVEVELPDPAVIQKRMRRRRILTLLAIGIALVIMPAVAVTQLRSFVVTR